MTEHLSCVPEALGTNSPVFFDFVLGNRRDAWDTNVWMTCGPTDLEPEGCLSKWRDM